MPNSRVTPLKSRPRLSDKEFACLGAVSVLVVAIAAATCLVLYVVVTKYFDF